MRSREIDVHVTPRYDEESRCVIRACHVAAAFIELPFAHARTTRVVVVAPFVTPLPATTVYQMRRHVAKMIRPDSADMSPPLPGERLVLQSGAALPYVADYRGLSPGARRRRCGSEKRHAERRCAAAKRRRCHTVRLPEKSLASATRSIAVW